MAAASNRPNATDSTIRRAEENHIGEEVLAVGVDSGLEVPLLDLAAIHEAIGSELRDAVMGVLESNRFVGGPELESFEDELASYCGSKYAVGLSSGTDALLVSLIALGIGPGDEVIVPAFTFFSTAGSVHRLGARVVFCDVDPVSFNLDPQQLGDLITGRTKAVIPVHLFGQCADMTAITDVCRRHGIRIVEDAAQAIGSEYHGKRAGSMGDAGVFSFFPSKNLGGIGDGGAAVTDDPDIADEMRSLRDHGSTRRYYHSRVGGNFRLDAIQAAALRVKLPRLERWHDQRRENARQYIAAFSVLEADGLIRLPVEQSGRRHVFNQFVIRVRQRDRLQKTLADNRIGTAIYYPVPLHLQDCFGHLGYKEGSLPICEQASGEVLALPIYPGLTTAQRNKVIHCVGEVLRE